MNAPETRRLIDFAEPVGLLMVGVVQFIPDSDDPRTLAGRYRDLPASSSFFGLSAFTWDNAPAGMADAVEIFKNSQDPIYLRTRTEIVRMFDGFELAEPGVVYMPECAGDVGDDAKRSSLYAGVGHKP